MVWAVVYSPTSSTARKDRIVLSLDSSRWYLYNTVTTKVSKRRFHNKSRCFFFGVVVPKHDTTTKNKPQIYFIYFFNRIISITIHNPVLNLLSRLKSPSVVNGSPTPISMSRSVGGPMSTSTMELNGWIHGWKNWKFSIR